MLEGEESVDNYLITDEEGIEYPIGSIIVSPDGGSTSATITLLGDTMSAGHTYKLTSNTFGSIEISLSGLYSTAEFEEQYTYTGNDLGAVYTTEATAFRLWAPTASDVSVNLYSDGNGGSPVSTAAMSRDSQGTWYLKLDGNYNKTYYTYSVNIGGAINETIDPYAKAAGVNGNRGMIVNLDATNPDGWEADSRPELINATDAVLYELHVRDLSMDEDSGIINKGKYLAFTETGTVNSDGISTGLDHIVDLGVTHVHLLPVFDFASVDEASDEPSFNWGYDPQNYNVPEGSYSTDPYHGEVRINEFKQMVQAMHNRGLRVVMDMVYNHTYSADNSPFGLTVPQYFYRMNGTAYANGSGCGNEVATERSMVRKYIVDSVVYWAKEYHIDGFRFDLMGLMDIETMNAIRAALNEIDPSIIMYGEGWNAGSCELSDENCALKSNTYKLDTGIAAFSDDMRDGLKGSVFSVSDKGFVNGAPDMTERVKFGIVASTSHLGISYSRIDSVFSYWAAAPTQCVNYAACHDNHTLWDRRSLSNSDSSVEDRIKMNKLTAAVILTSQGIPFLHSGEEMLRSKVNPDSPTGYDENSYKSSDDVNALKWGEKTSALEVYDYYKGLIHFRKEHPALRMTTTAELDKNLKFMDAGQENVIAYTITGKPGGEQSDAIFAAFNANNDTATLELPEGTWDMYIDGDKAGTEILQTLTRTVTLAPISAVVLVRAEAPGTDENL